MAEVPDDINDACQRFRQGDIIEGALVVEVVDTDRPLGTGVIDRVERLKREGAELPRQAPIAVGTLYSCIVSQTCDIVQNNKRAVVVAPVVPLLDPNDPAVAGESNKKQKSRRNREIEIARAKNGRQPHIIYIKPFGDDRFPAGAIIDLKTLTSLQKPVLAGLSPTRFMTSEKERRKFSFRCAHVFERPAIPEIFVKHVTGPLRSFLTDLEDSSDPRIEVLRATVADEWLALDDPDDPHIATLYFVGDAAPSPEAQEILNEWWEEVSSNMPSGYSLMQNVFKSLEGVNLKEARVMSLLTHWYLSDSVNS